MLTPVRSDISAGVNQPLITVSIPHPTIWRALQVNPRGKSGVRRNNPLAGLLPVRLSARPRRRHAWAGCPAAGSTAGVERPSGASPSMGPTVPCGERLRAAPARLAECGQHRRQRATRRVELAGFFPQLSPFGVLGEDSGYGP